MTALTRFGGLALAGWLAVAAAGAEAATGPVETDSAVDAEIERGDELTGKRDFAAARKAYRKAAKLEREAGSLPERSLRRIANSYYFEREFRSAADALDDLAKEAAGRDELMAQAWALADAAWVYGRMGSAAGVRSRVDRLTRLLARPDMPAAERERIIRERLSDGEVLALLR